MVDVAQLVEPRVVIPVVVGSSPIVHPTLFKEIVRTVKSMITLRLDHSFSDKPN